MSIFTRIRRMVPFPIRVAYFRIKRKLNNFLIHNRYGKKKATDLKSYPVLAYSHSSKLIRDYPEPWYSLQHNKIENLKIAIKNMDMIEIQAGKTFSFWQCVGNPSKRKGYKEGMTLKDGEITSSIGGGLCQLSNALHWAAMSLGFHVEERHRHSFDIFPDTERKIPFGTGATVFYNYVDLIFKNTTDLNFCFRIFLDQENLNIDIYTDSNPSTKYRIIEENHGFEKNNGKTYRQNEIYRLHIRNGIEIEKELLYKNRGLVLYDYH